MNDNPGDLTRRDLFGHAATGLGGVALAWLLNRDAHAAPGGPPGPHFPAKVKRVIQIFCCGGVSHLDTFDFKPDLIRHHGQAMTGKGQVDTFFGQPGKLFKSPFTFRRYGRSGRWVSDLFPHLATLVDDLTFVHSMKSKTSNHTPATFLFNTGFTMNGFPCLGAWLSYGLGSLNEDLPTFVVLPDPRGLPAGGAINWSAGFLPAVHQGVALRTGDGPPIADLATPAGVGADRRLAGMRLLEQMNRADLTAHPGDSALAARVRSYELAARMQVTVPEATNLDAEPRAVRSLYGLDDPVTAGMGRNCLLARRLVERGVRFVQLFHGGAFGAPRINWDAHESVQENHTKQAATLDKPLAGLLRDLKQRGLLDDTLVVWGSEFGRTPFTQGIGAKGRDHQPHAFTVWLAGGGLKTGYAHGASDEVGCYAAEDPVTTYDLHATILHLLGIDHKRLTFYHNGTRRRLTDVHGEVVHALLA